MGVPDDAARKAAASQGIAPGTAGAIKTELESLLDFKQRVDRMLDDLGGSQAESTRMRQDRLSPNTLGANFAEATGLYRVYDQVHDQLTTLSRLLSGQINGLSLAILSAHKGYKGTDDDVARQMWAIQEDLQEHYDPKRDPYADDKGEGDGHGKGEGKGADDGHGGDGKDERPGRGDGGQKRPGDGGSI
jgi:hypothetical protein